MNEDEILARFGIVPRVADLPEIRQLTRSMTADENRDGNEPLKTLCILLFAGGEPSDSILVYRAKMSSFDAGCYIDIQLTCGAGLETTKEFLHDCQEAEANLLLDDLESGISAGDFDEFTPAGHLESYRTYYGLNL